MKKILIIAALVAAALVGRAQNQADTVSVMLRHLQDTNAEIARINKAYTNHAAFVACGAAVATAGLLMARVTEKVPGIEEPQLSTKKIKVGLGVAALGAAIVAASVVTIPKGVTLDGRGLIVSPSEMKKKK